MKRWECVNGTMTKNSAIEGRYVEYDDLEEFCPEWLQTILQVIIEREGQITLANLIKTLQIIQSFDKKANKLINK